jgi:tetratricopeptide (TPR) repeat protein
VHPVKSISSLFLLFSIFAQVVLAQSISAKSRNVTHTVEAEVDVNTEKDKGSAGVEVGFPKPTVSLKSVYSKEKEKALFARAMELQKKGAHASAVRTFEEILRHNPKMPEAWCNCARSFKHLRKLDKSYYCINEAVRLRPDYIEAIKLRIWILEFGLKDPQATFADYARLEKLAPKDAWIYDHRGTTLHHLGEDRKAVEEFTKAIALGGGNDLAWCYQRLSLSYNDIKEYKKALDSSSKAIKIDAKNDMFYNNRATIYWELKDYSKAIADLSKAIELNPGMWKDGTCNSYGNRGNLYHITGKHEKAVADFTSAIKLMPNRAQFYASRAVCYCDLGKFTKAIEDANKTLELEPKNIKAFQSRYLASSKLGDLEQATADFNTMQQLNNSGPAAEKKTAELDSRDWQKLTVAYSKIIKLNPQAADGYYERGLSYLYAGKWQLASDDFQKFLKLSKYQGTTATSVILLNYIAYRMMNKPKDAQDLLIVSIKQNKNLEWPYPVLCFYRRQITEQQLLNSAGGDQAKLTLAKCYLGIDAAFQGNKKKAIEYLKWVQNQGSNDLDEYLLAALFLEQMKNHKHTIGSIRE